MNSLLLMVVETKYVICSNLIVTYWVSIQYCAPPLKHLVQITTLGGWEGGRGGWIARLYCEQIWLGWHVLE